MPVSGEGRVALVTGASGDLGGAIAVALDARGYAVAVHHHANAQAAEAVAARLTQRSVVVGADLGDWAATKEMVGGVVEELGTIGVLVHCAAVRRDALLAVQRPEAWAEVVQVNLVGTFHICRAVVTGMLRARYGRIVNVVSPAALIGSPGQTAYGASKAGVVALTRSLALECARRGVTVNALSPGYMETAMTRDLSDRVKAEILGRVPLGRPASLDEVSRAACFIVDADYMTGQVISVDGGVTAS